MRIEPRPGEPPAEAFGVPLFGTPVILEPRPRGDRRNLLLVSLDTLRADHVGAYGADLPMTPELDRVAAAGAVFEQAFATYPSTPGSHMTMLTGLYPATHRVIGPLDVLPPDLPTLPQILGAHGFQTAAFTEDGMLVAAAGFARGFNYYHENKGSTICLLPLPPHVSGTRALQPTAGVQPLHDVPAGRTDRSHHGGDARRHPRPPRLRR
jgi:hypothetical protein